MSNTSLISRLLSPDALMKEAAKLIREQEQAILDYRSMVDCRDVRVSALEEENRKLREYKVMYEGLCK